MKKNTFITLAFLAISCTFFITGCDDDEEEHTDPSFLIGTWSNSGATFTINGDYSFSCKLVSVPGVLEPGLVKGRLDYNGKDLGPDDYYLRNLTAGADGEPDDGYTAGNTFLRKDLHNFENLIGTLKPSSDKRQFTFSSTVAIANSFFGGTYNKQ